MPRRCPALGTTRYRDVFAGLLQPTLPIKHVNRKRATAHNMILAIGPVLNSGRAVRIHQDTRIRESLLSGLSSCLPGPLPLPLAAEAEATTEELRSQSRLNPSTSAVGRLPTRSATRESERRYSDRASTPLRLTPFVYGESARGNHKKKAVSIRGAPHLHSTDIASVFSPAFSQRGVCMHAKPTCKNAWLDQRNCRATNNSLRQFLETRAAAHLRATTWLQRSRRIAGGFDSRARINSLISRSIARWIDVARFAARVLDRTGMASRLLEAGRKGHSDSSFYGVLFERMAF